MRLFMFILPDLNINSAGGVNNPAPTPAKSDASDDVKKEIKQVSIFSKLDDNKNGSMEYNADNTTKMHVNSWKNIKGAINDLFSNKTFVTNDKLQETIKNSSDEMINNVSAQVENLWQSAVGSLSASYNVENVNVEYENGKVTQAGVQAQEEMQAQITVSTKNQLFDVVHNINNDLQAKYKELLQKEVEKVQNNLEQQPSNDSKDNSKIEINGKEYVQDPNDPEMYTSDGKTYFYDGQNMHYVSVSVDVIKNQKTGPQTITLTNNDSKSQITSPISTGDVYATYNDDGSSTVYNKGGSVTHYGGNPTGANPSKVGSRNPNSTMTSYGIDEQGRRLSNDRTKFNSDSDIDNVLDKVLSRTAKFDDKTQVKIENLIENYLKTHKDVTTSELQSMLLKNGIDYKNLNTVQRWYPKA